MNTQVFVVVAVVVVLLFTGGGGGGSELGSFSFVRANVYIH